MAISAAVVEKQAFSGVSEPELGRDTNRILKHVDNDLDKDRVLPFFNVECAWILRVTKGFELKYRELLSENMFERPCE